MIGSMLTKSCRPKYSVAEDNAVSLEVGKKWKKEIFEIMEGIQPGITRT